MFISILILHLVLAIGEVKLSFYVRSTFTESLDSFLQFFSFNRLLFRHLPDLGQSRLKLGLSTYGSPMVSMNMPLQLRIERQFLSVALLTIQYKSYLFHSMTE